MKLLTVSPAPHVREGSTTQTIMRDVLIALLPALVASAVIFGYKALLVTLVCVAFSVGAEYVCEKICKKPITISDLSAAVTGVLLSFTLPSEIPLWIAAVGSVAAIVMAKQLFGGIGQNFANPAIVGRVVLLISFGEVMSTYPPVVDGVSAATPLGIMAGSAQGTLPSLMDMFLGNRPGCLGETCTVALLVGAAYLLYRKVISWHIPAAYLATVAVFALIMKQDVPMHIMAGGLILGAFFMATDYSTSPMTNTGKLIYGVGCGLLTMLIRLWGSNPEGVSYAILLMNILTPHIEKLTRNKPLGGGKE